MLCAPTAADCGLYLYAPNDGSFLRDPNLRKPFARHLGGVNLGFLDGHASWINSEGLLARFAEGEFEGVSTWGPTAGAWCSSREEWDSNSGGEPLLY